MQIEFVREQQIVFSGNSSRNNFRKSWKKPLNTGKGLIFVIDSSILISRFNLCWEDAHGWIFYDHTAGILNMFAVSQVPDFTSKFRLKEHNFLSISEVNHLLHYKYCTHLKCPQENVNWLNLNEKFRINRENASFIIQFISVHSDTCYAEKKNLLHWFWKDWLNIDRSYHYFKIFSLALFLSLG